MTYIYSLTGIVMLEIFQYGFMVRAFIAGLAIGAIAPLIGTFLVAKRYALIADSLAHVSLAGIALGLLLGINPLLGALVVAVAVALVIERLRSRGRVSGELALAMFLSSGLALTIVLIGLAKKLNVDLFSYLFGSITTVATTDLAIILGLAVFVAVVMALLYKEIIYVAFDEEQAHVSGVPAAAINQLLIILAALTVVLSLRIVGGLLIGAMMVLPVAGAMQVAKSLRQTLVLSVIFGLVAVVLGLVLAFYLGLAAGGTIVLIALSEFFLALIWSVLE